MRAGTAGKDMLTTAPRAQERARSPWWMSRTSAADGVVRFAQSGCPLRCLAGKSRGHMQIRPVKVPPPRHWGTPQAPLIFCGGQYVLLFLILFERSVV